jgi:hypothetical protein
MRIYIENEGRQFGLESRVRLRQQQGETPTGTDRVLHEIDASILTFPVLRIRLWALSHGWGWPCRLRALGIR